jgi:SAM-dependent methyltransferase
MNKQEATQKRIWEQVATNWEAYAHEVETWFQPITNAMVAMLDARGGLLADLGCGAGSIKYPNNWRAIGLDIAEDMARAHGCAAIGTFDSLPFKNEAFDAIVSRFGFIFASDVRSALAQSHRALKQGGQIIFSAWGPPETNLWIGPPTRLAIELLGLNMPKPTDPSAFRLADSNEVRQLLLETEFVDISTKEIEVPYFSGMQPEEVFDKVMALAGPASTLFAKMEEAMKSEFKAKVLEGYGAADLTGHAQVWQARRPK